MEKDRIQQALQKRVTRGGLLRGLAVGGMSAVVTGCDKINPFPRATIVPSASGTPDARVASPTSGVKNASPEAAKSPEPGTSASPASGVRPTEAALPTNAAVRTATATSTRVPIDALPPIPTSIDLQTATPTVSAENVSLPFTDNFDNGMNPAWKSVNGNWHMIDKHFQAEQGDRDPRVVLGDTSKNMTDYVFDFDYEIPDSTKTVEGMVRVSQKKNANNSDQIDEDYLAVRVHGNGEIEWVYRLNGHDHTITKEPKPKDYREPRGSTVSHVRIVAQGDIFTAILPNGRTSQIQDDRFPSGGVGLYSNNGEVWFDNVAVNPLNQKTP